MSNTNEYEKLIIYFKKITKYSFISWIFVDYLINNPVWSGELI